MLTGLLHWVHIFVSNFTFMLSSHLCNKKCFSFFAWTYFAIPAKITRLPLFRLLQKQKMLFLFRKTDLKKKFKGHVCGAQQKLSRTFLDFPKDCRERQCHHRHLCWWWRSHGRCPCWSFQCLCWFRFRSSRLGLYPQTIRWIGKCPSFLAFLYFIWMMIFLHYG